MNDERIKREQAFHDERFSGSDDLRQGARKFYTVNQHVRERYFELIALYGAGKNCSNMAAEREAASNDGRLVGLPR